MPWWGGASAAAVPVLLVAGLTAAARLQPPRFDAGNNTLSALAADGARDSWIMTITFVAVAACDIVTALALRPAARAGRIALTGTGLACMMVAAFPDHPGGSPSHAYCAGAAVAGQVLWPSFAWRRGPGVPWGLRPATCVAASVALAALALWFGAELVVHGAQMGVSERIAGLAQAAWPLCVVSSCRRGRPASLPDPVPDDSALGA